VGAFSSSTTCSRLYAGNPVPAGLDAPQLYVAARPGVLPSVRAPGARPTPAAPDVGAPPAALAALFGLVAEILLVAWTLSRHVNGRRALRAVMVGRRERRWMTAVTIGFGLLLVFRSTALKAEMAEDAQRERERAKAEAAFPDRTASWRERLAAAVQSASADDGYWLVVAVENEIDSAQWSLGAPIPSSIGAIRRDAALQKAVLLDGMKKQRLREEAP